MEGEPVHVTCRTASSQPPANITWSVNGRAMTEVSSLLLSTVSLTLSPPRLGSVDSWNLYLGVIKQFICIHVETFLQMLKMHLGIAGEVR